MPHPATLIQQLGLTDGGGTRRFDTIEAETPAAVNALRNIYELSPRSGTKIQLNIPFSMHADTFPSQGYSDLVTAINLIHLPLLTSLDLSANLNPFGDEDFDPETDDLPDTDFSTFLASHPNLLHLAQNARGTNLTNGVALPSLRSFQGSFQHSKIICSRQPQLEKLVLTFIHL